MPQSIAWNIHMVNVILRQAHSGYSRLSRLDEARQVLLRTAKPFYIHSQASQRLDGDHPPVEIESNYMGECATKGKGFRRLAQRIDKGVFPGASIAYIGEYIVERCVGFL